MVVRSISIFVVVSGISAGMVLTAHYLAALSAPVTYETLPALMRTPWINGAYEAAQARDVQLEAAR